MIARLGRRPALGVAIAADRIVAARLDGRGAAHTWSRPLAGEEAAPTAERMEALCEASSRVLGEARRASGGALPRLRIALLPPLAECRRIDLPGLDEEEASRVISRDPSRYFPCAGGSCLVGVRALPGRGAFLAVASPARIVDAIHDGVARAGGEIEAIVPAHAAWAAWAGSLSASGGPAAPALAAVLLGGRANLLHVDRGALLALRRLSSGGAAPSDLADRLLAAAAEWDAVAGPALALAGAPGTSEPIAVALEARGARVWPRTAGPHADPVALAALHAASAHGPLLLSAASRARRERRRVRRAATAGAAAAVVLASSAAATLWATGRELRLLEARRAALREPVAAALAIRDTAGLVARRLAALQRAERESPRWSGTLATLARELPREAHLLALVAEGDSVVADVAAERAAPVLESLAGASNVLSVRAQGSIRTAPSDDGGGPLERFTLVVRLAAARTSPLASAASGAAEGAP